MSQFDYEPSLHVPFRDRAAIARCRAIKRGEIEKHPNPDFRIKVVPDADFVHIWLGDMFARIMEARDAGRPCVMLMPNPWPGYINLARMINRAKLSCKHVWWFAMDEYADQDGRIAPPDWERGFTCSLRNFLWKQVDADLRPPLAQVIGLTNDNIDHYLDLMNDAGGLDISYTGPGWTGHLAFCEPDAPEFLTGRDGGEVSLEEWKQMGARICTLSPFTIAQNSLHGSMGFSGDLAAVPPKAATIGPKEVISARHRIEVASITVGGTAISWERMIARLCYHGPVTPRLPSSIHQLLRTDCYLTESIAADIRDTWEIGY
jgi:glucosamine-6-phosphate deaminase